MFSFFGHIKKISSFIMAYFYKNNFFGGNWMQINLMGDIDFSKKVGIRMQHYGFLWPEIRWALMILESYIIRKLWQYGLWSFQLERFLPKNQHTQRKLLNFDNSVNGEVSKSAKIWLSKSIFYVKIFSNASQFFFIEEYQFRSTFFDKLIFKSLYFLKLCPIFDTSPLHQFSKFNNFLVNSE